MQPAAGGERVQRQRAQGGQVGRVRAWAQGRRHPTLRHVAQAAAATSQATAQTVHPHLHLVVVVVVVVHVGGVVRRVCSKGGAHRSADAARVVAAEKVPPAPGMKPVADGGLRRHG